MRRRYTTHLVIHCADTPNGNGRFTIDDIRDWHVKDNGWADIGYHRVIHIDGECRAGRIDDDIGAHCRGLNSRSVGVCLIGLDAFTVPQWEMLKTVVQSYQVRYPGLIVVGHRERDPRKVCPGFDVQLWLAKGMRPESHKIWSREKHIC